MHLYLLHEKVSFIVSSFTPEERAPNILVNSIPVFIFKLFFLNPSAVIFCGIEEIKNVNSSTELHPKRFPFKISFDKFAGRDKNTRLKSSPDFLYK